MNEDVNIPRSALLSEIIEHPGSFSPCKGGVQADLKDKSKLNACIENPTPENTHWFANTDALKNALTQMSPEQRKKLQEQCAISADSIAGNPMEMGICEALSATPASCPQSPTDSTRLTCR